MVKIIFFQPHPDDLDIFCPQLLHHLTKKSKFKYEINIASMTRGEEGIKNRFQHFKGERIGKIRTNELFKAMRIYGITPKKVHFFGMLDGSMKFNNRSITLVRDYLNKVKADIIFAPEPMNAYYLRQDHIITGKILYYLCEKSLIQKTPTLYYYSPINPNFLWPYNKQDFLIIQKLTNIYKSQYWLYQQKISIHKLIGHLYGNKIRGWKYAEGYRRIFFGDEKNKNQKLNLFQRIFRFINSRIPIPISLSILIGILLKI